MPTLPIGTVTFLFTDIEGSTRLWEKHPKAMQANLARHDYLLRLIIEAHGGCVFKTVGDAFCAAFHTAPAALEAALAIQRTLLDEDWGQTPIRVRSALHTGAAQERDGDYFGPTLNRTARLLSAGHGGQILLSMAAQELARDQLLPDASLHDLGEHQLKDLERAEHIFQLVTPDLPADFPPLKTLVGFRHNLPQQLTSFVGREKEIAEVKQLLGTTQLLTLTGPGGTGKTRLSLQVAADLLDRFSDGVWLVEFAPITNLVLVPQAVASTLGLHEEQGVPLIRTLVNYLHTRSLLLILDNCEHLIDEIAQLVDTLLKACPRLQVMASSREILGITGEISFRVPSLSTPELPMVDVPQAETQDLTQYESVRLFMDRAVAAQPEFQVTNANMRALVQICCRLDGIPLAIELAAARMRAMSLEQIASRIDDRFRLLTGGSRTALPRQQTLRALIDWSYDLLSVTERLLLNRLAVFMGGFTLDAAEAVCYGSEFLHAEDILDVLTHLVDKSLVIVEDTSGETRYCMLETIRQYARDRLLDSGEAEMLHNRHLDYFLTFAQHQEAQFHGPAELAALQQLERELDNLRAALDWSLSDVRVEKGLQLIGALWFFWSVQGYWQEGSARSQSVFAYAANAARNLHYVSALFAAGFMSTDENVRRKYLQELVPLARDLGEAGHELLVLGLSYLSDMVYQDDAAKADAMLVESLALARSRNRFTLIAMVLRFQGHILLSKRDLPAARRAFEESYALCQKAGDRRGEAISLRGLAHTHFYENDYPAAAQTYQEALRHFRELNDRPKIVGTLFLLGDLAYTQGEYEQAKAYWLEGNEMAGALGILQGEVLINLGYIALLEGDLPAARTHFLSCLAREKDWLYRAEMVSALLGYTGVILKEKKARQAAILLAFLHALFASGHQLHFSPANLKDMQNYVSLTRALLDAAIFEDTWGQGSVLTLEQAVAYAIEDSGESNIAINVEPLTDE
ncbi:MAG: tetratricopeptide repeat protein [Anaerolineales bacterium]|nr:tetratricopeptide repeat protein [Anaerolineales bacterium]